MRTESKLFGCIINHRFQFKFAKADKKQLGDCHGSATGNARNRRHPVRMSHLLSLSLSLSLCLHFGVSLKNFRKTNHRHSRNSFSQILSPESWLIWLSFAVLSASELAGVARRLSKQSSSSSFLSGCQKFRPHQQPVCEPDPDPCHPLNEHRSQPGTKTSR